VVDDLLVGVALALLGLGAESDLLRLLDAERLYQEAKLGWVRAETQRYTDTTQLFVAMGGGGWWSPSPDGRPS